FPPGARLALAATALADARKTVRHARGAQRGRILLHARARASAARSARSPARPVSGNDAMDAALPLILLAMRARVGPVPAQLPQHRPRPRQRRQPQCSMAARAWRGWQDATANLCVLDGRHVGRSRVRSAWIRALCEVSLVRSSD